VNTSASQRKDPSTKDSDEETKSIEEDMSSTKNDDVGKNNLTKTDPLSIRKAKRRPLKSDGQVPKFLCGRSCKFRAKRNAFEPGVSGSGKDIFTDPVDLEGEKKAEERIESWNALARERQAQDETKRKTGASMNRERRNAVARERQAQEETTRKTAIDLKPKEDPNQVRVTLTTLRNAQGQITGTSTSRSLLVPANLDMAPPDLSALTTGDEEYMLIRVSKQKRKCWVTYLNGGDPDTEHEFYYGMAISYLIERDRTADLQPRSPSAAGSPNLPQPPRLARVQMGEMVERRVEERERARAEKLRESTREGTHTRFQRQASESGGGRSVPGKMPPVSEELASLTRHLNPSGESPSGDGLVKKGAAEPVSKKITRRGLKESCKTMSPSSPDTTPSPLLLRTQWMMENDPRTE
jgi:hypothetical protein